MSCWDGFFDSQPYTVDDQSLLRAIGLVEDSTLDPGRLEVALWEMVIEKPSFQTIRDNDHLRALLRAFLEANILVARKRTEISDLGSTGIYRYLRLGRRRMASLQDQLRILEAHRDEAWRPYEMLRKLTDKDNVLLHRYPA